MTYTAFASTGCPAQWCMHSAILSHQDICGCPILRRTLSCYQTVYAAIPFQGAPGLTNPMVYTIVSPNSIRVHCAMRRIRLSRPMAYAHGHLIPQRTRLFHPNNVRGHPIPWCTQPSGIMAHAAFPPDGVCDCRVRWCKCPVRCRR